MPQSPMAKTTVEVVQDTHDYGVTDAEVTTHRLHHIPTVQNPPPSARSVQTNGKNKKSTAP